jgi:hypothetical protein
MTTYRQIEANRRNALKSTGPKTETGKKTSRCNAVRHGLTAETRMLRHREEVLRLVGQLMPEPRLGELLDAGEAQDQSHSVH